MPVGVYERMPAAARFWGKVNKDGPGGCWLWGGGFHSNGYGQFNPTRKHNALAHRYAYEQLRGIITEGLTLDHLCRNRACVNPEHLEPVTNKINILRGKSLPAHNAAKTHCLRGHPYDMFNTYTKPNGQRVCKTCRAADPHYHLSKQQRQVPKLLAQV